MSTLLKELEQECGSAVSEVFKELFDSGHKDIAPEAEHIAQGILRLAKTPITGKGKSAQVISDSLQRQLYNLKAICKRRGYQAVLELVIKIASIVVSVLLKRLGV
jgi:hypothetical protein